MTSSAPELLHELKLPCSLGFCDVRASNVSGMPSYLHKAAALLLWKLASSRCHKRVIIILALENQLCLAVMEDCHGLLRIFYLSLWAYARNSTFDREKKETVTLCGLGARWEGQGLPMMVGPGSQDLLHCPSQEHSSQEGARSSHSLPGGDPWGWPWAP